MPASVRSTVDLFKSKFEAGILTAKDRSDGRREGDRREYGGTNEG